MNNNRVYQYDSIKAILIFLVVLGHILSRFGENCGVADVLYKIIFSFHMAAFLFVSGYFAKYNPKKIFKKMLPLYFIFQLVNFAVNYGIEINNGTFSLNDVNIQFFTPKFTLWFLFAIMAYQLLIPLVRTQNKKHRYLILFFSVVFGILISFNEELDNFMAMSRIITLFPFYLLGFYEKDSKDLTNLINKYKVLFRLLTAFISIVLIVLISSFHNSIESEWLCNTESYDYNAYTWVVKLSIYLVAFLWILILLVWTPSRKLPFSYIGRNTLSVYLLHAPIILYMDSLEELHVFDKNLVFIIFASLLLTFILSLRIFADKINRISL